MRYTPVTAGTSHFAFRDLSENNFPSPPYLSSDSPSYARLNVIKL